jgi:hypothetical protein
MILTTFLNSYIPFRYESATLVEIYIVDQIQEGLLEFILKDNGIAIENKELKIATRKTELLKIKETDRLYQYFHKGMNNLQINTSTQNNKTKLIDLNSTIVQLMLQFHDKELVFTYLSPKGEYVLNSKDFLRRFTKKEIASKDFILYLNEIFYDQLKDVAFSDYY